MFGTRETLAEHSKLHEKDVKSTVLGRCERKRKIDEVTPVIEPMPEEMAKRHRAVYSGPSRTFSVGQKRKA